MSDDRKPLVSPDRIQAISDSLAGRPAGEAARELVDRVLAEALDAVGAELDQACTALDDALAWIVNGWKWDQAHYDELDAVRERLREHCAP